MLFSSNNHAIRAIVTIACIASGATAWGFLSTQVGCTLQGECDPATVYVPAIPNGAAGPHVSAQAFQQGAGIYQGAWQSGPAEGPWMPYPGSLTYVFYPTLADGGPFAGPYIPPEVYVSADPYPLRSGSNGALASGNLAEYTGLSDGGMTGFEITNATCSPYYLWLRISQEYPQDAGVSQSGSDGAAE